MKNIPRRTLLLILVGLALVMLLLLAGGLRNLTFLPGHALPFSQMLPDLQSGESDGSLADLLTAFLRVFFILGWLILPFFIIYLIISPEARKRFLRDVLMILPLLLLLYFLVREPPDNREGQIINPSMENQPLEEILITPVPTEQFVANPSDWLVTLATAGLAIGGTFLLVGIIAVVLRTRQPKEEPLARVAEEAQAAIDAIEAGGDLRDVILRCYYEMNRAIGDKRNLKRDMAMTAHEFEHYLMEKGLPSEPIHNLTDLFERVRYGAFEPGRQEERLAISSLSAIVSAVQRATR